MDGRPLKLEFLIHGETEYMRGTNSLDGKCPKNADTEFYSRTSLFESVAQAIAHWV
jgi:23S rRNA maturation mini-RNase III